MSDMYYLCFKINRIPDLTLTKYSTFDISGSSDLKEKHGVFLRQLHRLGYGSGVYFHLLYVYDPDPALKKGNHLDIIFYATSAHPERLQRIRAFLTTSVLSDYYDFYCYEINKCNSLLQNTATQEYSIASTNLYGAETVYPVSSAIRKEELDYIMSEGSGYHVYEIAPKTGEIVSIDQYYMDNSERRGSIRSEKFYQNAAFLTKKDEVMPALNRLPLESEYPMLYSILEIEPCADGRLYNVLKLMEGYNVHAALRIDLFPVDMTAQVMAAIPFGDTRKRTNQREQGRDDNSENMLRSWEKYTRTLNQYPQFHVNITAFADEPDVAVMLADSVGAEAIESGTYRIEQIHTNGGFQLSLYDFDDQVLQAPQPEDNYLAPYLSLFTLNEIRPMFCFPILNPGENIEKMKETDPEFVQNGLMLGRSSTGYDVVLPPAIFRKHAFIAGVPGSGKTNTMLYLVTRLWKYHNTPFLVLEPAKQEYRALAMIDGMEDLCIFSPSANTKFHLHINPFEFPEGLSLSEHINNLKAVFMGAFEFPPPSPHFLDTCLELIYIRKGWNVFAVNDGSLPYPTMRELFDTFQEAVEKTTYSGEYKGNLQSVLEVRIGSLIKREIGMVYDVPYSIIKPEEWLEIPAVIELEPLGEGPANFMSLLLSTLIRESLKVRAMQHRDTDREVGHVIFYEEAHNLIGPNTDNPLGDAVDPKVSATKYLVKMLAEVRALHEGIVIADQLPSVMAPEVLKNTGLKIGHRITATDDRAILGGTMSAEPAQLEEQGTFSSGEALVTYEGNRKPFKMRIAKWERETDCSPDDKELYARLSKNEVFRKLEQKSAEITAKRAQREYAAVLDKLDAVQEDAVKLKKHIRDVNQIMQSTSFVGDAAAEKRYAVQTNTEILSETERVTAAYRESLQKAAEIYDKYREIGQNFGQYSPSVELQMVYGYLNVFGLASIVTCVEDLRELCQEQLSRFVDVTDRIAALQEAFRGEIWQEPYRIRCEEQRQKALQIERAFYHDAVRTESTV